ncbi:NGX6/PGAP6/MYMK [Trypanosoma melophagium]|uniref:NGX6/PGAP6/MYMK n=1 Tax=Trypanosoma melophagium TaxID=715481 RepID=UPI00351AAACF|nr:NGX6/PGAP6/MYMK [Trypanosoma melophagium]
MSKARDNPPWITFLTCCLSHLALFPTMRFLHRQKMHYEFSVSCFAALTSFMYHTSECFHRPLFLSTLKWHRLDNIGAITSLTITCLYLSCFESETVVDILKYVFLFFTIILQEFDPWNVTYTILPVFSAVSMVLMSHLLKPRRRKCIIRKNLVTGLIFCLFGAFFFSWGLDNANDPFRIWHGLFHVCIGLGLYQLFICIKRRGKVRYNDNTDSLAFEL